MGLARKPTRRAARHELTSAGGRVMTKDGSQSFHQVPITSLSLHATQPFLDSEQRAQVHDDTNRARALLAGRTVWNINSTAVGGGVAEMLQSLLGYARGAGIDARWLVIQGDQAFFRVTKRLHNFLHGHAGDGGTL